MSQSRDACDGRSPASRTTTKSVDQHVGKVAGRRGRRLLAAQIQQTVLVLFLAALGVGLAWIDPDWNPPAPQIESAEAPDAGIIVRSEATHLWLPEALGELAIPGPWSHTDLRRFLELRHLEKLRYAITLRGHQVNGEYSDITFIRHPCDDPQRFQELLDILADTGVKPDRDASAGPTKTVVHIVSEQLLSREPSALIDELRRLMEAQKSDLASSPIHVKVVANVAGRYR